MILQPAEKLRRLRVLRDVWAKGLSLAAGSRALKMAPNGFRVWVSNQKLTPETIGQAIADLEAGSPEAAIAAPAAAAPLPPGEARDAAFWRKRAGEHERRASEAAHLAEQLAGVRRVAVDPPEWMMPRAGGDGRAVLIAHTSDWHAGEVVNPGEIEGMNAYNPDILRERMRRFFVAACEIGSRWMVGSTCDGVLVTLAGDLVSGDIHEELMRTNALLSNAQVKLVAEVAEAGLRLLLGTYPRVHVAAVPGNHGRQTHKSTAKLAAGLSYDILVADILRERFRDDGRVSWTIATGADVRVPLYGRTILVTHGDKMGTGGGQGFAGPVLPIIRGGNKVRLQSMSAGLGCDLVLMGHYHTSAAPPGILANGSVVGYSEFGNQIRAAVEPPKQWLARFSQKWGLCERLDVQLDEAPKSRMRFK